MSVIIKVNGPDPLVAHAVKRGDTWELIRVKGIKDRKLVTLWPTNAPTGIKEGDTFRVTSIESFKVSSKKDPRGLWHDEISLNVAVEKVGGMPGTMRKPKTTNYESSAPQWSPPPKEETPPMYEPNDLDEGLPW